MFTSIRQRCHKSMRTMISSASPIAIGAILILGACQEGDVKTPPNDLTSQATQAVSNSDSTFSAQATSLGLRGAERINYIMARMSLEEKLGQLHQMPGGRSKNLNSRINEDEYARVRNGLVGSYLHVAGAEFLGGLQKVAVEESRHGIPLLFAMDVVHGYQTIFPVPLALASSFDDETVELSARIAADEASAAGLHWTFAPMVDVARDPRWGRIVEGAGEEPYLGARMSAAQVRGFQGEGLADQNSILATAKHLGAYGAGIGGRDYNSADISERTLREVYLPPFYAAAQAGTGSFMVAFNDIAGVPTTSNKALLDDLLRGEWGYEGVVLSDWNSIAELIKHGVAKTRADAGALALTATVDMEMTSGIYVTDMAERVKSDSELQASLDASVSRILMAKDKLGLFDTPYIYHNAEREAQTLLSTENRAIARDAARKSIVLLKNEGNQLPLSKQMGRVAVIGGLADDAWSPLGSWRAQGKPETVVTIRQGLETYLGADRVIYAAGAQTREPASEADINAAVIAAKSADHVVLVIGEDYDLSGEARSRSDISIPAPQLTLAEAIFAAGTPVTVVLMNGRPIDLSPINDKADAILETWMLGVEMGPAVAEVLFGDYSPAGRLPASFPRNGGSAPYYMAHNATGRPADPDVTKDTARYMDLPITPLYAFGHGLSYSTFEYGALTQSSQLISPNEQLSLSFTVTNTGAVQADEVVQLYIKDPIARIARPVQELRGYHRLSLAPNESQTVSFTLTTDQFAYWGPSGGWEFDAGTIEFMIGAASDDIRLSGSFDITDSGQGTAPAAAIATPLTLTQK